MNGNEAYKHEVKEAEEYKDWLNAVDIPSTRRRSKLKHLIKQQKRDMNSRHVLRA